MYVIQGTAGGRMVPRFIGLISGGVLLVVTNRADAEVFLTIDEARVIYRRLADPRAFLIVPAREDRK